MGKGKKGGGGGGGGGGGDGEAANPAAEAKKREEETKRLFATLVDLDPLKSLSTASAALGEASTGLVTLTRAYEESKALVTLLEKKRDDLTKEIEKQKKEIAGLKDDVKFQKHLVTRRPRHPTQHPFLVPGYIRRILWHGAYNKGQLSELSVVCKPWREACQAILFARFVTLTVDTRSKCEALALFFKERPAIALLVRSINVSFHAITGPAGGIAAGSVPKELVPLLHGCKKATGVQFQALGTVAATRYVLAPLSEQLTEVIIDPEEYARISPQVIEWARSPFRLRGLIGVNAAQGIAKPHQLFCDWKALKSCTFRRLQIQIYPQQPSSCALARLQLVGCQVSGSLLFILANSIQSLRELGLAGCGGISLDETIEILEVIGPRLSTLTLRGNRFIAAFTERSFDAALAGCQELQELRLDLALPISSPEQLLAHQPKLQIIELHRSDDDLSLEIWQILFGAVSKHIAKVHVVGLPFMPQEIAMLKDEWRWLGPIEAHFAMMQRGRGGYR